MSDAARQKLKVSREGIVLIKSFEGFRPRAIQRVEGGWIIGYGHTLSAREGATVSEADAELLLRYDLIPVEASVNQTAPADLNQHQFDALVSFAFSVGADDFAGSDVRHRLNAGALGAAADAMMGWPEPILPETALRRRAAERALFVANPAAPVALSDLLAAPLASPPPVPPAPVPPQEPKIEPVADAEPVAAQPEVDADAPTDPRGAAVAALLGEPPARLVQDETIQPLVVPAFAGPTSVADEPPAPSNDNPPGEDAVVEAEPTAAPIAEVETATGDLPLGSTPIEAVDASTPADAPSEPTSTPASSAAALARYAPYSLSMVGPLPYLQVATTHLPTEAPAIEHAAIEVDSADLVDATPVEPTEEPAVEPAPVAELVLTPAEDSPEPAFARPLWTPEEISEAEASQTNLFGEDVTLTLGGSVMRHEIEPAPPARSDWKAAAPLVFMGAVGLVSFGAAMAAFRQAAIQPGSSEQTVIGGVLALIGLGCVGVSSINLYRKFGRPGGD